MEHVLRQIAAVLRQAGLTAESSKSSLTVAGCSFHCYSNPSGSRITVHYHRVVVRKNGDFDMQAVVDHIIHALPGMLRHKTIQDRIVEIRAIVQSFAPMPGIKLEATPSGTARLSYESEDVGKVLMAVDYLGDADLLPEVPDPLDVPTGLTPMEKEMFLRGYAHAYHGTGHAYRVVSAMKRALDA